MIEEAHIIEESEQSGPQLNGFFNWFINQADSMTKNDRGGWATEILIAGGYVDNPEALRTAYLTNKPGIDAWMKHINVQKVIDIHGTEVAEKVEENALGYIKKYGPAFAAGTVTGALTALLMTR